MGLVAETGKIILDIDGKDQEELLRSLAKLFKYEQQKL
jgi:phosphotransferase system HPr-like phosphotransfer protein